MSMAIVPGPASLSGAPCLLKSQGSVQRLPEASTAQGLCQLTPFCPAQVVDILSRKSICERASIDECYIDITAEAQRRLAASSGQPAMPVSPQQVHVCGKVRPGLHSCLTIFC